MTQQPPFDFTFAAPLHIQRMQAPYAVDPLASRGRKMLEAPCPHRTEFQRDRDRLIHSSSFRRLKHKTQVFIANEGDHYRTRLTHSLEVAQISRTLARSLGVNEDLAETIALAHDLGHPPFGHAGERALNEMMARFGGFDHNAQALRVLTQLEHRYAAYDGLNLTWETLEGLVKHNGPMLGDIEPTIATFNAEFNLKLHTQASLEAQIAAVADDIAYCTHDVDDGLRAGLLSLEELAHMPLVQNCWQQARAATPTTATKAQLIYETTRRLISLLIDDVRTTTQANLAATRPLSADAVRAQPTALCGFSPSILVQVQALKRYMFAHVYASAPVLAVMDASELKLKRLFAHYMQHPQDLPPEWPQPTVETALARSVCDYIAGMTDLYAMKAYDGVA